MFGLADKKINARLRLKYHALSRDIEIHSTYLRYRKHLIGRGSAKQALLIFLRQPLIQECQGIKTRQFSNTGMVQSIAKCLNRIGYEVDAIDWDEKNFEPAANYNLVVAHGGVNFDAIIKSLDHRPKIIYFSSGSYWKFHNEQEKKRFAYFKKRHGVKLQPDRLITHSEESVNRQGDAIIAMGEAYKTYSDFPRVYKVNNAVFLDKPQAKSPTMIDQTRHNFLFFSGPGNIHKGLDLLLDVFKTAPDLQLFICSALDKDFEEFYKQELYHTPNIHYLGFVNTGSREYHKVMDSCAFCVLPSCSEGHPGSVIECMQHGLIPVVTKEAHIDVSGSGILLNDSRIETLSKALQNAVSQSSDKLAGMSQHAVNDAVNKYSIDKFEKHFTQAVKEVVGK